MVTRRMYVWAMAGCLVAACGSRLAPTAETHECHESCDTSSEQPECRDGSCSGGVSDDPTSEAVAAISNAGLSHSEVLSIPTPNGTAGTAPDHGATAASGCRVAYVEYPVGATIPVDGCGYAACTCDASGALVDCTKPSATCAFDGNGPIRHCKEMFPEGIPTEARSTGRGHILGNQLTLEVSHVGGCARHDYALCFQPKPESEQAYDVELIYDPHADSCEASVEATLRFDLAPMGQYAMNRLGTSDGIIRTAYGVYTFGALTCAHRDQAARIAVTDLLNSIGRSCATDEDCTSTRITEECTEECNAVSRVDQVYSFDQLRDSLRAGACNGFLAQGCEPLLPLCERRAAACLGGRCELSPI